jgi:hypothetical protein
VIANGHAPIKLVEDAAGDNRAFYLVYSYTDSADSGEQEVRGEELVQQDPTSVPDVYVPSSFTPLPIGDDANLDAVGTDGMGNVLVVFDTPSAAPIETRG